MIKFKKKNKKKKHQVQNYNNQHLIFTTVLALHLDRLSQFYKPLIS